MEIIPGLLAELEANLDVERWLDVANVAMLELADRYSLNAQAVNRERSTEAWNRSTGWLILLASSMRGAGYVADGWLVRLSGHVDFPPYFACTPQANRIDSPICTLVACRSRGINQSV